MKEIT